MEASIVATSGSPTKLRTLKDNRGDLILGMDNFKTPE